MTMATFACADTERRRVAVVNHTRRYFTYVHAAYSLRYDTVSKTLCGKRFYDPSVEGYDWEPVNCRVCLRAMGQQQER